MWTGELLLVTTRAGMRPEDIGFDITWFIPAVLKYRRLLGEVLLASFFLQLFALLTPLFTQVVIDKVLVHKGFTTLHVLAIGMVAVALFDASWAGCAPIFLRIPPIGSMWVWARNCSGISWRCRSPILKRAGSAIRLHACANSNISANFLPAIP